MDLVRGVMGDLAPKLFKLLKDEYKLQKGLRKKVVFVSQELESIDASLRKVAQVPWDQLDEQVKLWARQVREASYDMDDVLDSFLVNVEGGDSGEPANKSRLKRSLKKIAKLFRKGKARHDIAGAIQGIEKQLQEVAERRTRYKVDEIVAEPAATSTYDPRVEAMYNEVRRLVGISKSSSELSNMLSQEGHDSNGTKIVSIIGTGGLGKTTLAKAVHDKLKSKFSCAAFVPVGRKPNMKKVLRDILLELDKDKYMMVTYDIFDERQLINELRDFLQIKSYFIVLDDLWDASCWDKLKLALLDNDRGSRVLLTTRNSEVASGDAYKLQPLSHDDSKMLLYTRIFGEVNCPANHPDEVSNKILDKCGGLPLAIITMGSLLVGKSTDYWLDVCTSPGFYRGEGNQQLENTEWILSLSYSDLPSNLKTCLLYLSTFAEDEVIETWHLIRKWVAEGFIEKKIVGNSSIFQEGEACFKQLVNRCMIEVVSFDGDIIGCRVHDMVLDMICRLSQEENFVVISSEDSGTSSSGSKVRRLVHHKRIMKQTLEDNHMDMSHVRTLVANSCGVDRWVLHQGFKVLRVLDLYCCGIVQEGWQGLKHLGSLFHLRYLGIRMTFGIVELPEDIGKLKKLQILDLEYSDIGLLPSSICHLTELLCLLGGEHTCPPDGLFLTKMKLLEELDICIDNLNDESKMQFMKEPGNLSHMRNLRIVGNLSGILQSGVVQSTLSNLHKLEHLYVQNHFLAVEYPYSVEYPMVELEWDREVFPQHLSTLDLTAIWIRRLPSSFSPANLPSLKDLSLRVDDMDEAALRALGGLPELIFLTLYTGHTDEEGQRVTVVNISSGDGFFNKLIALRLCGWMVRLVPNEDSTAVSFSIWNGKGGGNSFVSSRTKDEYTRLSVAPLPAVMPKLITLSAVFPVSTIYKDGNGGGCNDLGLECLPSLQEFFANLYCSGASPEDVEKAEAELRHESQLHPNGLKIELNRLKSASAGDEVAITESGDDDHVTPSC